MPSSFPRTVASRCAPVAVDQDADSVLLRLEISDQGIGIAPELQGRLFRAFSQADDSIHPPLRRHRPRPDHFQTHRRS
jgi:hypothetical protein